LFPETHLFMEQVRQRFNLNVWTFRSKNDPIQYLKDIGETDPSRRKDKARPGTPRCQQGRTVRARLQDHRR
jgi:hypothetical protein